MIKINNLDDLHDKRKIDEVVLNKIKEKHNEQEVEDNYLTELQQDVFSEDDFWDEEKNIIVRGRTSSGKTLVAQIAAAYFGANERPDGKRKKIIYLVPLRAMVSEKKEEFSELFEKTLSWKVYASSSDYQDHDEDILKAEFSIAVIVYEKFFALLAQDHQSSLINNCGVVIVDELQMMNDESRGPKLEISLTKMLEKSCKIIGLTTTQCDVEEIGKWLDATEITNNFRPKALEEYVVWPGETGDALYYYMEEESRDGEISNNADDRHPDDGTKIELKNHKLNIYQNDLFVEQKMVPAMISHILGENKTAKILVFINNRRHTRGIAEAICDLAEIARVNETEDQKFEILLSSGDEDAFYMKETTLPYGVAYHHGGLSRGLRNYIESEFRKGMGQIQIVVATETLAIGINMPADVVILVGVSLPHGKNKKNEMHSHEYKNYVGRAGRLGKSAAEKGKSYLLASSRMKANDYWGRYIKAKQVVVSSALRKMSQKEQVPYFFNLIGVEEFDQNSFNHLIQKTCAFSQAREIPLKAQNLPGEKFIEYLFEYELIEDAGAMGINYNRSRYGDELVSYALDLDTVKSLIMIQKSVNEYFKTEGFQGKKSDFLKKHCLDFLYCLSDASELRNLFVQNNDELVYTRGALEYVRRIQNDLIEGWRLKKMIEEVYDQGRSLPNVSRSFALKRAILIYEWKKGKKVRDIKKDTGLNYINIGDLDRMADIFAYLWEAMVRVCSAYMGDLKDDTPKDDNQKDGFRGTLMHFSGCLKYGVEEDLVVLASRHIGYVTRDRLMQLKEEAKKAGFSPVQYIRNPFLENIPRALELSQYKDMVDELNKHYYASAPIGNINVSVDKMTQCGLLDEDCGSLIKKILDWEDISLGEIYGLFGNFGCGIKSNVGKDYIEICCDKKEFRIYLIDDNEIISANAYMDALNKFGLIKKKYADNEKLIFLSQKGFAQEEVRNVNTESRVFSSVTAFLRLYLLSIKKTSALLLLFRALSSGYTFIPEDDTALSEYIMNFMPSIPVAIAEKKKREKKSISLYLIHDKASNALIYDDFQKKLLKELADCQLEPDIHTMVWGDRISDFADEIITCGNHLLFVIDSNYNNQAELKQLMSYLKGQLDRIKFILYYFAEAEKQAFLQDYPFLQGVGQIELSLMNNEDAAKETMSIIKKEEIKMTDVFISYVHEQKIIAEEMKEALEKLGCEVFIDTKLKTGDSLVDSLNDALKNSKSYLLVVDKKFLESAWTQQETKAAFISAMGNKKFFPLWADDEVKDIWLKEKPLYSDFIGVSWESTNAEQLADDIVSQLNKNAS